jgi:hypothetical protein
MADKKITQLNELFAADGADVLAVVDVTGIDETKKITVNNLMGTPGPIGGTTPNTGTFTAIQLNIGPQVDEISIDTNLGNNNNVLPTQNAVKTYVDNKITAVVGDLVEPKHVSLDSTAIAGDIVLVNTTTGDVTITLIENPKGRITVKKISSDSNEVIIVPESSATIDGNPSVNLTTENESLSLVTDTSNFYIV